MTEVFRIICNSVFEFPFPASGAQVVGVERAVNFRPTRLTLRILCKRGTPVMTENGGVN